MRKRIIVAIVIVACIGGLMLASKVRTRTRHVPSKSQIRQTYGVPVTLARLERGDIEDTIQVTGDLQTLSSVTLSAKIQGKVFHVSGRAGDHVANGQVAIRLDPADAESQLRQAEAALLSANAAESQAGTALKVQETLSSALIEQAKAQLEAAEAQLSIVKKPTRTQQEAVAENQVITAKANLANAKSNYKRIKDVYDEGGVSAQMLEQAETQYEVAKAQYDSAAQNLSLVKEGSRKEEILASEQQVRQAKEALRVANANAAQVEMRREDIKAAKARVSQAQASVAFAKQQLSYCTISSPINGFISSRMTEPGETANPGVPLMTVVDLRTVYFEAQISETVLEKVRIGQTVQVRVDAFPGRIFRGTVARILPVASTESRNTPVRIHVMNPTGELRPGMFARGSVKVGVTGNALLAPADAVEERYGDKIVFTVKNGKAALNKITPGASNDRFVQILEPSNLRAGDEVALTGHESLSDGVKVALGEQRKAAFKKLMVGN